MRRFIIEGIIIYIIDKKGPQLAVGKSRTVDGGGFKRKSNNKK